LREAREGSDIFNVFFGSWMERSILCTVSFLLEESPFSLSEASSVSVLGYVFLVTKLLSREGGEGSSFRRFGLLSWRGDCWCRGKRFFLSGDPCHHIKKQRPPPPPFRREPQDYENEKDNACPLLPGAFFLFPPQEVLFP